MMQKELLLLLLVTLTLCQTALALDYYKVLDIDNTADDRDIKRAYRTLSKKHHPDKNPDDPEAEKRFLEVSQAYEVLIDPEQRKIYDRYGEEGLKQHQQGGGGGPGFHSPFDIFKNFFGGGGGHEQRERKGPNAFTEVEVDLKDIYSGRSLEIQTERKIICTSCKGSGARKPEDIVTCPVCSGQGVRIVRQMLAPGMYQQLQMPCDHCRGHGRTTKHVCSKCKGARVIQSVNTLTLDIDRGLPEGSDITFPGQSDESPDLAPGDVIVRVKTKKSPGGWVRRGSHLYWKTSINVADALLGFEKNITHLDDHPLNIGRSEVTQPNQIVRIEGEGLPHYQSSGFGDLFIEYNVVLPSSISPSLAEKLESAFSQERKLSGVHQDL